MISFKFAYLWVLLIVGEYFIQGIQAEINQMVAEYERTLPEVKGENL